MQSLDVGACVDRVPAARMGRQLKRSTGSRNLFSGPIAVYDKMDPETVVYWSSKGNARG